MNAKEIVGRMAIIGGVTAAGGSTADFVLNNKALQKELARQAEITESVRNAYGVAEECVPVGLFSSYFGMACFDEVPSAKTQEEEARILAEASADIETRVNAIRDPVAEARGRLELAGFLSGLGLAALGMTRAESEKPKPE